MVDIKLYLGLDYNLDIDIVEGEATVLDEEVDNLAQRASVGAFLARGSVPGAMGEGVDWGSYFTNDLDLVQVDNQTKQQVQAYATSELLEDNPPMFMPFYEQEGKKVQLHLMEV